MRRVGWGVISIVVLALMLLVLMFPPVANPSGEKSRARYQPGAYGVKVEPFEVVDLSRPTPVNGSFAGSTSRSLNGKVWRPESDDPERGTAGSFPLVIYSHGFMSYHEEGRYLANFLASRGYVVVAVDYPLTNYFAPGNPSLADVVNQPGDISFIIDRILERNQRREDSLYGQVDAGRIAVAGLSLGGMTTELVTFDPRQRDPRIKAAVSIAGPARMFTQHFFTFSQVPFLVVAGDQDAMVSYEFDARPLRSKDPDSVLVTLKGGSHAGFADIATVLFRWANNPDYFGCLGIRRHITPAVNPFAALRDERYGVVEVAGHTPCENYENLPRAMRPSQQQMLATLAVYSFLDSLFNAEATSREQATAFLLKDFSAENSDVQVEAGDYLAVSSPLP